MESILDGFDLSVTCHFKRVQSSNITRVKAEVVELWKLVNELHERPVNLMPIITEIQQEEEIENIWGIDDETLRNIKKVKKRKKRTMIRTVDEGVETAAYKSIISERDWPVRVQDMVVEAGSSRTSKAVEKGSGINPTPYIPQRALVTTVATTAKTVLTIGVSTTKESGAQSESPRVDPVWAGA